MTEKKANKIANDIKDLLVKMAVNDRLPTDMTQLNEDLLVPIILGKKVDKDLVK